MLLYRVWLLLAVTSLLQNTVNGNGNSNCQAPESGFDTGPQNVTLSPGVNASLQCTISDFPSVAIIWHQALNGDELRLISAQDMETGEPGNLFTYNEDTLILNNISVLYHGEYYCNLQNPCSDVFSPIGYINVISPILMTFDASSSVSVDVTDPLNIPMKMFGYPPPKLTLYKQKKPVDGVDQGYELVTSSHVSVTTLGVTFDSVEFTDEGMYKIIAENSEGNTTVNFTVIVRGVVNPDVSLNQLSITPESYGTLQVASIVQCSVPKFAFDSDSGSLSINWYREGNLISDQSSQSIYQNKLNETTQELVVRGVQVSDNGLYLCRAENQLGISNHSLSIIGPPQAVQSLKSVLNGEVITWNRPELFGAEIAYYSITFKQGSYEIRVNETKEDHEIPTLCPGGIWSVSVTAVNQYRGIGESASINLNIPIERCISTSSASAASTNGADRVTSTSSTVSTMSRQVITSVSTSSTMTRPSIGANEGGAGSLPIAAGAAAGAFLLIILMSVLVFAIACYITVSKRGSNSRAEQQWGVNRPSASNNDYGANHMENGYVKQNAIDGKSPDSQINNYEMGQMGLPSPIPANPGYGPIYIDPRFEYPRENLDFTDILYDGAFTVIYKAKAKGINENKPMDVAVKQLKDDFLDFDDYSSALIMEMEQLAQLEPHPNIVGLIRVCSVTRPVLMIMEYMCHGDLLGFLRTTRGHTDMYTVNPGTKNLPTQLKLTSRDLLSIIRQVATGMQFLSEQKIVHGALCARNVLVTTSMEVRIFNIGIHNLDNDETLETLVRWMAPEVFIDNIRTSYGDVWSFGVLMWEVVTLGGRPYADSGTEDLYTQLMSGVRLSKPIHCAQPVYDIMSMCWETIPQHRPMFFEINDNLENMNLSKMSYLDLRNYNETAYSQFDESERQQTSIL